MMISIWLWGKPGDALGEGQEITAEAVREHADAMRTHLRKVENVLSKLTSANWTATVSLYDIQLFHPAIHTEVQAQEALAKLGVDPDIVQIIEDDEDVEE